MENQYPNPTIPKQDIFDATKQPSLDHESKQEIIKQHGGGRKVSAKWIFIAFGLIIFLLIAGIFIKTVTTGQENKEIKLTWWGLIEDEEAVRPLIEEYKSKEPNVTITFQKQSSQDYRERLTNSLNQGRGPDIFEFHNSWVPMVKSNLAVLNEDLSSNFYPVAGNDLRSANGFYGVPLEIDGIALFINTDLFQAYGKNPPRTWDEFKNIASQLTVRESDGRVRQAGAAIGTTTNIDYWQDIFSLLILQNGADLVSPNSPSGMNAVTYYTNFSKLDKVWNDTLPNSQLSFINGNVAMYFGKYSDIFKIRKQKPGLKFSVVSVPQLPTNMTTVPSVSYASYYVAGVSAKSVNKIAAWDFLKFIISSESLKKLHQEEIKVRGYGNLYPRVDMQGELTGSDDASPFIYQANFARSFYLYGNTNDGPDGINSQMSLAYKKAIDGGSSTSQANAILGTVQGEVQQILAKYGLFTLPRATP